MPSIFAITPASNNVRLTADGHGEFVFTVTNTSGQPIIARARVTPQDPKQQAWYKIQDDPQRSYTADKGTEQIKVQIAVPPSTPPGSCSFHLDVISVSNPDELFTIGPVVSFEVPKPKEKKPMPLWPILAGVAAVVVIGIVLWFVLSGKKVPDLTGLTQAQAEAKVKDDNLKIGAVTWQRTGTHVANTVISQTPPPNSAIPENQTLSVVMEQVPFATVPNLVGMDIAKAQDALASANLTAGPPTNNQDAPGNPNTVLSQDPRPNLQVAPLTTVNLVVKATTVRVPSLIGQSLGQAISTLTATQLIPVPVQVVQPGVAPLTVTNQVPPATTIVARQSTVNIYVAIPIPSSAGLVTGLTAKQYAMLPGPTKQAMQMSHPATAIKPK